ncbi:MAG: tetratricopeptide repeat protein [Streptosporangiaceae bacterium]
MAEQTGLRFAGLLRQLRAEAGLTQEELAEAASLSPRSVSDLERGIHRTAHRDTAGLLADALGLTEPVRALFVAAARGRGPAPKVLAARQGQAPGAFQAAATRTLPRDIAAFTGRQAELAQLMGTMASMTASGGVVGIHAIGGMAGVGKTTFAVHAAHRLAGNFPDGQLFLPLHGHTPGRQPVHPGDALASLLLTAGVPAVQIPPGVEARMALWRGWLAGRQLLLVLDDAVGSEQVLPLLPGAYGSLVLVTSRRHLSALDDARTISLDILPPDEAAGLLVRLAGRPGLSPADPAVRKITRLCGYLPLAIGMLARQLQHHPAWSLADRAAELSAAQDRLELMATEDLSVTAAFNSSYEDLTPEQRRLFRRLGLHPGTDIDGYAAAALDGAGLATARRGLEALYDHYLLTELAHGRYRLHDLIRAHARSLADRLDPDGDRELATARLLDYYQHTAAATDALLARQARPAAAGHATPAAVPVLADPVQALAWVRAERASLLACLDQVTGTGQHARIIALTAGVAALLSHDGPWAEAITRHATALRAARHLGDRPGQAGALTNLADVRRLTGDVSGAARDLEEALGIHRDLGNRLGQADALTYLGDVRRATGDYPGAARDLEEALGVHRDLGNRLGQANALTCLGRVRRLTGDYPGAARDLQEAMGIYRDIGERGGEAESVNEAGTLHRVCGDLAGAGSCHQQALGLARQIGSSWDEAHALAGLGRCALTAGHTAEADDKLRQALKIFQRIGAAEAADLSRELGALTKAGPTG